VVLLVMLTTTCPTCGGTPCGNVDFCRLYRDADQRKAKKRLNRLAWSTQPELPESQSEKPAAAPPLTGEWAADAWNSPTWKLAAHEYHQARGGHFLVVETPLERLAQLRRLMGDDVSLNAAWHELNDPCNRPTPKAAVDAVVFAVRKRGLAALKEPAMKERLARCDAAARAKINEQIEKLGE
jgi:hypothetical protein